MKLTQRSFSSNQLLNYPSGQAAIMLVLVVSIVVLMFTHVAVLSFSDVVIADDFSDGELLQMKTEGYLESAAIRYLRDVSYTGETLIDGEYSCTMVVTDIGGDDRDLESSCTREGRMRKVGMQASYILGTYEFSPVEQR